MAPASRSAAPGGAAGVPRCFSLDQCDGAAPPRPAQPLRPIPLKRYPDMVVSSWQPPPCPAACPHPAANISLLHPPPQPPGGAETKPAAGTRPRDLGDDTAAPGTSFPRGLGLVGAGRSAGTGRKRRGTGTGRVAQRVPACGRHCEARTPPELPLPVRCSAPGANGGRRVSASSGSAGPGCPCLAGAGNGREGRTNP